MPAVKTVTQRYSPNNNSLRLLDQFRHMINDCLIISLQENAASLKTLSLKSYRRLAHYEVMSYCKLCAISRAAGLLKNYRKARRRGLRPKTPYTTRLQLTVCYGFKVKGGKLHFSFKPRNPIIIPLNKRTVEVLSGSGQIVRSITLTAGTVGIAFSKETVAVEPTELVGIDNDLNKITIADSQGNVTRYDVEKATKIKANYRAVKSCFTRNDARIRRKLFQKYGQKQRDKTSQILHNISKRIVEGAKVRRHGIVMETLKHIRNLYRKGNGQARVCRAKMNGGSFRGLQRQIEYKARWEGVKVIYVPTGYTSRRCAVCGSSVKPEERRTLTCPQHGTVDRDVNAARNILARGKRFVPYAPAPEAMVQELSQEAILKVDVGELTTGRGPKS